MTSLPMQSPVTALMVKACCIAGLLNGSAPPFMPLRGEHYNAVRAD
jgi:hypothetical protein